MGVDSGLPDFRGEGVNKNSPNHFKLACIRDSGIHTKHSKGNFHLSIAQIQDFSMSKMQL